MSIAAGVCDHRGWAVVVCIGARDGVPFVADRRRIELVDDGVEGQPFHHAGPEADADDVAQQAEALRTSVGVRAEDGFSKLRDELDEPLVVLVLEDERVPLSSSVRDILASQQQTIAADGAIYRDAIRVAGEKLGAEALSLPRGSETDRAAEALGASEDQIDALLAELGRAAGPPWRKEHRKAAAAAISALGARGALHMPGVDRRRSR